MKKINLLFVTVLLISTEREARACNGDCDKYNFKYYGTRAALGTIVVVPLLGLAFDRKPDSPYLQALGFTALAAGVGWGIGAAATFPDGNINDDALIALIALPVVLGMVATVLVYRFWPRGRGRFGASAVPRLLPVFSVTPSSSQVSIGFTYRL